MSKKGELEFEVVEDEKQTAVVAVGGGFAGAEFVPVMISNLGDDLCGSHSESEYSRSLLAGGEPIF